MKKPVKSIQHKTDKRAHIPSGEEAGYEAASPVVRERLPERCLPKNPIVHRGQDPELYWMHKYGADDAGSPLSVDIRSLYRQEHIGPELLIKGLYRVVAEKPAAQGDLWQIRLNNRTVTDGQDDSLSGEPDIRLHNTGDTATVKIAGLDIYDPIRDVHDINYWMLDDDYDGSSFIVRQVFFCGGDKDEFDAWKKGLNDLASAKKKAEQTLKITIDAEAFANAYGIELLNANDQLRSADNGTLVVINEAVGERREIPLAR